MSEKHTETSRWGRAAWPEVNCQVTSRTGQLRKGAQTHPTPSALLDKVTSACFDTVHTRVELKWAKINSCAPKDEKCFQVNEKTECVKMPTVQFPYHVDGYQKV